MHTGLEEERDGFSKLAAYFAERAAGGVGLIVTGGIAPNRAGLGETLCGQTHQRQRGAPTSSHHRGSAPSGRPDRHANSPCGALFLLPFGGGSLGIKSPISWFKPWALSKRGVENTIKDFVRCAVLAKEASYDGVEIMGSEGYLINQFIVRHTNKRTDEWGGSYENRDSVSP